MKRIEKRQLRKEREERAYQKKLAKIRAEEEARIRKSLGLPPATTANTIQDDSRSMDTSLDGDNSNQSHPTSANTRPKRAAAQKTRFAQDQDQDQDQDEASSSSDSDSQSEASSSRAKKSKPSKDASNQSNSQDHESDNEPLA